MDMVSKRDRHSRGLRGPLASTNPFTRQAAPLPGHLNHSEFFMNAVQESIEHIRTSNPDAIATLDIGVEEVPEESRVWDALLSHGAMPLAAAIDALPNQRARVVLYRRPIERRAADQLDLHELVHHTLVEQVAVLTGRNPLDLDPNFERGW
ncbi:MAG: metallopeptidase family protein [Propionibacteriaceae bacterium]|jgi:predicted Zn-dependent protease with MMP-like domain|nr:metallopeptidase family protein [Propionibacteriaceae bacterium]